MTDPTLTALSPLDGRYAARMAALRPLLSEFGLMHRRVQVEVEWFVALSDAGLPRFAPLGAGARAEARRWAAQFTPDDAAAIKSIERTTNHDVKAVEYWLKRQCDAAAAHPELAAAKEFIHFACTSEDINNTSHALMLGAARAQVLQPALTQVLHRLRTQAEALAEVPMLSRTHGQTASPTTVGKEFANVAARLARGIGAFEAVQPLAKMNGAVGNYNAHTLAWPALDWPAFAQGVVEQGLGLAFNAHTTQIEPHDWMAAYFDALARCNTIGIDLCRDLWGYISLGYFTQALKEGEVGSSAMPHKVNPIDFENAEGNFGVANALLAHLSHKLPLSRWQRDLTDSTVLRTMGTALGHALLGWDSLARGLDKIHVNRTALAADLDNAWEVLAEAVQTVMRLHGLPEPYEQLKAFTRGKPMTRELMQGFIAGLPLPEAERARLLALQPAGYTGLAADLARRA